MTNVTDLPQFLENGLRFTLGAGTALVDSLQDTDKRETTLKRLQTDFDALSQEWVDRGTQTEQEARQFVESILAGSGLPNFNAPASTATVTTTATAVPHTVQDDLKELTAQIIALREALEQDLPPAS